MTSTDSTATRYSLDTRNQRLWREAVEVAIPPKPFLVLLCLVENANTLVTREMLLDAVWPGVKVSPDAVRYSLRQVRMALGDRLEDPLFIETVPRRGWRFVGTATPEAEGGWQLEACEPNQATPSLQAPLLVGRERELRELAQLLEQARAGERQLALVMGEAGIGKTSVVEAFLSQLEADPDVVLARGQCIEFHGDSEPYLPILEVLECMSAAVGATTAAKELRQHAPMWLAQLPSLSSPSERDQLLRQTQGASPLRMRREFSRVFDALTQSRSMVLWIDDLHWSDLATVELLAFLAQSASAARLLIVASFRPVEAGAVSAQLFDVMHDVNLRGSVRSIAVAPLDLEATRRYLHARLCESSESEPTAELVDYVHNCSQGNALFIVGVVEDLLESQGIGRVGDQWDLLERPADSPAPSSFRHLLDQELRRVSPVEREALEVASIAGLEFAAAALADGSPEQLEQVEATCSELAEIGRFILRAGTERWPDGTVSSRFRFIHTLYRDVLIGGLSDARRVHLCRRVARRLEAAYRGQEESVAAALAGHYERASDHDRAIHYLQIAGDRAGRLCANPQAVDLFSRAIRLVEQVSAGTSGDLREIPLRMGIAAPLAAIHGYGADELKENLERVEELAAALDDAPAFLPLLLGLWSLRLTRGELSSARDLAGRVQSIAETSGASVELLQARRVAGHTSFYLGRLEESETSLRLALRDYDVSGHERLDYSVGDDPVVLALSYSAWTAWFQGLSDTAVRCGEQSILQAERLEHPPSLAFSLAYDGLLHLLRRDPVRALERAERCAVVSNEGGFALWSALSRIVQGWALARIGTPEGSGGAARGLSSLDEGLSEWRTTGTLIGLPYFLSIKGELCVEAQDWKTAATLLAEIDRLLGLTDQPIFGAERHRLDAALSLPHSGERAELCLLDAIALARKQGAHALTLRAALPLWELLHEQGRDSEASQALSAALEPMQEGFGESDFLLAKDRLA